MGKESLPATSTMKAQLTSWALYSVVKYQPSILHIQIHAYLITGNIKMINLLINEKHFFFYFKEEYKLEKDSELRFEVEGRATVSLEVCC
jgi:hypothetical protein